MGSIIKTITFYERPFWREKGKTPFLIDLLTPGMNKFDRVGFETNSVHQTALGLNLSQFFLKSLDFVYINDSLVLFCD